MNTVLERNTIENVEKEQHNAMISERYRKLLDAVEDVFSAPVEEEKKLSSTLFAPQAPTLDGTPSVEQTPTVTEFSSVLTQEKLERLEEIAKPIAAEATKAVVKAAPVHAAARYSLTPLAKALMAAFTALVVVMMLLIGINSHTISEKKIQIRNLEEKKQELIERSEELQRRIQELQTDESVIQRAQDAGLLN